MTEGKEIVLCFQGDFLGRKRYENYLDSASGGQFLAPRTRKAYSDVIVRLEKRRKPITFDYMIEFLRKDQRFPVKAALTYYLRALGKESLVSRLPKIKAQEPKPRDIPGYEDLMKVISMLDEEEDMIAKLLLNTGMRCHEAFKVKLGDVSQEGVIIVEAKGGRTREVRVPDEFLQEIFKYLKEVRGLGDGELIFYTESKASLHSKVITFWKRLNSVSMKVLGKNVGTHDFRRFYATYLYKRTKDLQLVQRLMGHKNIETTIRYTRYATREEDLEKGRKLIGELSKQ